MLNIATQADAHRPVARRHKRFVPGKVVVRWNRDIPRRVAAAAASGEGGSDVPEQVRDPIAFLRENYGLRRVRDLAPPGVAVKRAARRTARGGDAAAVARSLSADRGGLRGLTVLEFDRGADVAAVARLLEGGAVEYAQPAPARWLAARNGGGDPHYNSQWGLPAIGWYDAKRPGKSTVKVAVLDSGVDRTHPDLARAVSSYDRSGFSASDLIGHGTHVAGIIGATVNNEIGIAGVAPCRLCCWKIFGDEPADDGEIYMDNEAYYRALEAASRTKGVRVINLSLGGFEHDETEAQLIERITEKNEMLVVAAMGNEFDDGNPREYPAALPDVLSVGAVGPNRRRALFSNTGRHIGLVAPGVGILSTLPRRKSRYRETREYDSWDGTSMATPFVSGAAALVWTKYPSWTAKRVRERLLQRTTPLAAMRGSEWTPSYGSGLLNLQAALR